jgi:hypothetical protein
MRVTFLAGTTANGASGRLRKKWCYAMIKCCEYVAGRGRSSTPQRLFKPGDFVGQRQKYDARRRHGNNIVSTQG